MQRFQVNPIRFHGYGPDLACCRKCRALWEPIHHDLLWDPDDPLCSFSSPCSNCAFRKGSPEQTDAERWSQIKESLEYATGFYCHKGVPIEAGAEHGFAYPERLATMECEGVKKTVRVGDKSKLRLCRGWLNAFQPDKVMT